MKLAIFDFDGTIYKYETYTLMMDYAKKHPEYSEKYKAFYYSIVPPYVGYKMHVYSERKMKANLTQKYLNLFHSESIEKVEGFFQDLANQMQDDFHPLVLERIEEHYKNEYFIMVVSGAYKPLLEAALQHLPIDLIVGTEIPINASIVDAEKPIDHIQAERKSEIILEKLKDKVVNWKSSYAYGDSISDLSVLEMVGNPVAVCPDVKLQHLANVRGWTVLC